MNDPSSLIPEGFTPNERLMFEKAECTACGLKIW